MALQKRSSTVSFMPGAWSTSAWWHVCAGHTYKESALRELQEEIGEIDVGQYKIKEDNEAK